MLSVPGQVEGVRDMATGSFMRRPVRAGRVAARLSAAIVLAGLSGGCSRPSPSKVLPQETAAPEDPEEEADLPRSKPNAQFKGFPAVEITNGLVRLVVCVPDAEKGYYRGVRFDWSGLIARADHDGHTFVDEWQTPHDPTFHDHAVGTAEEFDMDSPPGFDEAKPGEPFVKIGVGVLRKTEDPEYGFWKDYEVVECPAWSTRYGDDLAEFRQELTGPRGWGYAYTKRIALKKDAASFVISHVLENTGKRPIETDHYCHNFFIIDGVPIGTAYRLKLPFEPTAETNDAKAEIRGNDLVFVEDVKQGADYFAKLSGFADVADNAAIIENVKTGASVAIRGDLPPFRFNVYAHSTALCPEMFVKIRCAPGEEVRWETSYTLGVSGR